MLLPTPIGLDGFRYSTASVTAGAVLVSTLEIAESEEPSHRWNGTLVGAGSLQTDGTL